MRFGLPIKLFDAWERLKTVAEWFGYSGLGATILTVLWTWLVKIPVVWWPVVAAIAVILFIGLKTAHLGYQIKKLQLDQERVGATLAPALGDALVASVQMILEKRQQQPQGVPTVVSLEARGTAMSMGSASLQIKRYAPTVTIGPTASPEYIPLSDALTQAYNLTKDGALGPFAQAASDNPEEVLDWYGHFSVKHIKIYGKQSPGTVLERIPKTAFSRYRFFGGAQDLRALFESRSKYTELSVRADDVPGYLERIVEADAQLSFELGFQEETERRNS